MWCLGCALWMGKSRSDLIRHTPILILLSFQHRKARWFFQLSTPQKFLMYRGETFEEGPLPTITIGLPTICGIDLHQTLGLFNAHKVII